jgi:hypothetical protein
MISLVILESVGALSLVIAYVALGRWWSDIDLPFLVLNIVGASLLAAVAWSGWHLGFAVLWSVWLLAAVRALLGLVAGRRA